MEKPSLPGVKEKVNFAHTLFSRYGAEIHGMIMFHVGDKLIADDFYQDLFLTIVKYPPPKDLHSPPSYLWKIIANNVRHMEQKQKCNHVKTGNYLEHYFELSQYVLDEPFGILSKHEGRKTLINMIQKYLSPAEAKVILEKLEYNSNTKEIASKLGIKRRSVSHYLCSGIKKLRAALDSSESLSNAVHEAMV